VAEEECGVAATNEMALEPYFVDFMRDAPEITGNRHYYNCISVFVFMKIEKFSTLLTIICPYFCHNFHPFFCGVSFSSS
jgi:hypothetical protein